MSTKNPSPILKWAGGKRKLTGDILSRMPSKIKTYYEPFIGGGAVFFELAHNNRFEHAIIGDCNAELINVYKVTRDNVELLIQELNGGGYQYEKTSYLKIRAILPSMISLVERAARFIFLNKTGFNGLYRVNKSGQFNVPFGKYTNPTICDEVNLRAVSKVLQGVEMINHDFESIISIATEGDAVYLDPPYIPLSKTSNFTSYNSDGFNENDHRRLAESFDKLIERKVCCVLSNSYTPLTLELYGKHDVFELIGARSIGGPATSRVSVKEVLISKRKMIDRSPQET